ncbi:MAG: hypothetical protein HPY60_11820 [Candidatus Methanofastidiosum sp.]|nr:hypothetical protein [Methanofastidiosum sp.]
MRKSAKNIWWDKFREKTLVNFNENLHSEKKGVIPKKKIEYKQKRVKMILLRKLNDDEALYYKL